MGCVYAITPFNFPLALMVRQIIPALVAGCVVLAKPSEKTPLSCIALHELCTRSLESNDIYDSPLEIVISTQPASLSEHLINDARIHMLAFIGSSQTGRALAQMAARKGKRMLAELGGNAPCVVYNDADVRKSVAEIVQSKMRNSGQACVAVNRVYVHAEVYEEFCEGVLEEVKRVPMGSYGPLISEAAAERVCGVIEEAVAKGARVIQGGEVHGCFVEICVLRDCEDGMRVFEEEVFGPVIAISKFEGEEVWERANGTDGSLAAFLFTRDLERVLGQRLRYGMVGVNTIRVSDPSMAFGSFGETWREGGMACLDPYLTTQNVVVAV